MKKNIFKYISPLILQLCIGTTLYAQDVTNAVAPASPAKLNMDWVLLIVAIILVFPIFILSNLVGQAVKTKIADKSSSTSKITTILFLILTFGVTLVQAQTAAPAAHASSTTNSFFSMFSFYTWLLILTIFLETYIIYFLSTQVKRMLDKSMAVEGEKPKSQFEIFWSKINNFKPISEEAKIDVGHDYDGIHELDNVTPIWFKAAFGLSILFAIVYLWRYHVSSSAPLQIEEYNVSMENAKKEHDAYLATSADKVDESTVVMGTEADIVAGNKIFQEKCKACHLDDGGGQTGPNLTDAYWLHGGDIKDIFKSIKYGWPDKGMISWKDQVTPKQMADLSSFIMSLQGTKPKIAKEPQGELYNGKAGATGTDTAKVSTTAKKDSLTVANATKDTLKSTKK